MRSDSTAMSASAGVSVQKRLSDQRARLLALDYHDPFTAESLALVERLFEDLVTTTESYEDLQQRVREHRVQRARIREDPHLCMMLLVLLLRTAAHAAFGVMRAVFLFLLPRKQPGARGCTGTLCTVDRDKDVTAVQLNTKGLLLYSGAGPQVLLCGGDVIIASWTVGVPAM